MSKRINIALAAAIALGAALPASAQYDQNISVEGKYVPEFIPHDRIGMFPGTMKFGAEKSTLPYSFTGVDADFVPKAIAVPATGWRTTRKLSDWRGYLDFGLGSWLNSTLSAGYRFIDDETTTFGIRLQHNSTSLWKPDLAPSVAKNRMERYDESVGLYGHHDFEGAGRLDASLGYHIGNFNYYGFNPYPDTSVAGEIDDPAQTLNDAAVRVGWTSESGRAFSWRLGAGARYFALRRLYLPSDNPAQPLRLSGGRETDANLSAGISYAVTQPSTIGLDLDSHLFAYGGYYLREGSGGSYDGLTAPDTYGALSLTPYYNFSKGSFAMRLGVLVDLAFNAGNPGERYRTVTVAPDVRIDYNAGPVALYAEAGGGNELHTLAGDWQECYYHVPAIFSSKPSYTPIDAKVGFSFGPFSGFHAGFDFAYRITHDQDFFGWYQTMLSGQGALSALGLPAEIDGVAVSYFPELEPGGDIRGFSVGLNMGYDAGRYFKIDAAGTWQPQKGKTGYYNGMDRPAWTATGKIESNPWSTLKLKLGCDWRGSRAFPALAVPANGSLPAQENVWLCKVKDYLSLNFGAAYDFNDRFGIWVQGDNLTNRKNIYSPGLPEPGITITGGISLLF